MGKIEVFHGTDEQSARRFEQHQDLYGAIKREIPTAIFSNDIRYSVIFAGGIGRGPEVVTTWNIPKKLLISVDSNEKDTTQWYYPNIWLNDLSELPWSYLQHTKYPSIEIAKLAVERGEIKFFHVPNEYYVKYETVATILTRF